MNDLDALYARLLTSGFIVLRQAVQSGNAEWIQAELEMLHNVPSLLGESNVERHRYYWLQERTHYIEWATATGRNEAKSRRMTYYEPIWAEMEPVMDELFALHDSNSETRV